VCERRRTRCGRAVILSVVLVLHVGSV
jgi:hypothetical protein